MSDGPASYPDEGALLAHMCQLLKAARTPIPEGDEGEGHGLARKDWPILFALGRRLSDHLYFEHKTSRDFDSELWDIVRQYEATTPRPNSKEFARQQLRLWAQPPVRWTVYMSVGHLELPLGTSVGDVQFLRIEQVEGLDEQFKMFTRLGYGPSRIYCSVPVIAGTDDLALARARRLADSALALVRQKFKHGFPAKILLDQLAFGLEGFYVMQADGIFATKGWWSQPDPIDADLKSQSEWATGLAALAELRESLSPKLRERIDTALDWLDVGVRTDNWRIIFPALFSAMEALLVPETAGLKAGAVTVRSIAVQAALGQGFLNPGDTIAAYEVRSKLVHGDPTNSFNETALVKLAENRQRWAFGLFSDYLHFASAHRFQTVPAVVAYLDSEQGDTVCVWLDEHGHGDIVEQYRGALSGQ